MIARFYAGLILGLIMASSAFAAIYIEPGYIIPGTIIFVGVFFGTLFCIIEGWNK